ncbi:hypothetical protein [Vulcanococcus limneticus]|uniref:hypothetical protein n=1 Tax=Vulcanococcus limneticus TaxID=2170428 RepID=UPI0012FF9D3F|nr:hypothetical protein [Vulcanococcus limneticus]MCP9791760.1 hypothetical protein [Vulcanococcus limneticus MW73D5]MCP9893556.1 hypothetical protein [Vulcanococcus limneticus Candia 3F8]MCP9897089.1 hypothetical protein [Vulcanococcus limneticus Candia 3B3]
MRSAITAAVVLLASPALADGFPVVGGYGFDWLKPKTTSCHRITQAEANAFKACRYSASGNAFGLPSSYHSCVAPWRSEVLIYASQAKCAAAFNTMQANEP